MISYVLRGFKFLVLWFGVYGTEMIDNPRQTFFAIDFSIILMLFLRYVFGTKMPTPIF